MDVSRNEESHVSVTTSLFMALLILILLQGDKLGQYKKRSKAVLLCSTARASKSNFADSIFIIPHLSKREIYH